MSTGPWTIEIPAPGGRCWSVNEDHRKHHYQVAAHRKQAREAACLLARSCRIPPLGRCRVEVTVFTSRPRSADTTNYLAGSTVKAAIDGLVDAGVVPDDSWQYMRVEPAYPPFHPLGGRPPRVVLTIHPWMQEETGGAA